MMMLSSDQTEPSSLVDRVLGLVRGRILSGEYEPGSHLRLHALAEQTGASLIPVREALRILEAERLVETTPNRGARVAPISRADLEDLYRVRVLLETQSIRDSGPLGDDEKSLLAGILESLQGAFDTEDYELALRLHRQFHFGLYSRASSEWLLTLIDLLWKHTERYQRLSLRLRVDSGYHEHWDVLEAISSGDVEGAAQALKRHLETTAEVVGAAYTDGEVEEE